MSGSPAEDELDTLIRRALDGDLDAQNDLYPRVEPKLKEIARRQLKLYGLKNQTQTTGIVDEAFVRILRRGRSLHDGYVGFLKLAKATHRGLVIDRVRRRDAQKRGDDRNRVELDHTLAEAANPYPSLEQIEREEALHQALADLADEDPELAQVAGMRLEGFSFEEIAERTGLSKTVAIRRFQLAQAKLKRALSDKGFDS